MPDLSLLTPTNKIDLEIGEITDKATTGLVGQQFVASTAMAR